MTHFKATQTAFEFVAVGNHDFETTHLFAPPTMVTALTVGFSGRHCGPERDPARHESIQAAAVTRNPVWQLG